MIRQRQPVTLLTENQNDWPDLSDMEFLGIAAARVNTSGLVLEANDLFIQNYATRTNTDGLLIKPQLRAELDGLTQQLTKPKQLFKGCVSLDECGSTHTVAVVKLSDTTFFVAIDKLAIACQDGQHMQAQVDELRRAKEDLEQLSYAACHDLRSPLRAMTTIPAWISQDTKDILGYTPASIEEHTQWLQRQAKRMDNMLDSLLCYVTIDSDRESTAYESLDLELLINEVWKSQSGTDALELTLELQHPPLNAPRKHIVLILKHLIANAVVHHDKKAGCVRVTLSHTKRTSSVCIQDDGPGIDPQYRQEALRLFSTLKKRDEKEGSGMGLPIVNKIVSSLGGKLNFGLGLHGRGSSISISIPRCSTH